MLSDNVSRTLEFMMHELKIGNVNESFGCDYNNVAYLSYTILYAAYSYKQPVDTHRIVFQYATLAFTQGPAVI